MQISNLANGDLLVTTAPHSDNPNPVREAILELVTLRGSGKTICPTEAAKAVSSGHWRKLLSDVRPAAVRLAKAGQICIFRKGKPVDPETFKGVYRLGLQAGDT